MIFRAESRGIASIATKRKATYISLGPVPEEETNRDQANRVSKIGPVVLAFCAMKIQPGIFKNE